MPPRVLLVLPVRTYRATAFLRAARALGAEAVVASEEASSLAAYMEGRHLVLDLGSPDEAAVRAAAFAEAHPVDAVVGVDESAALTAAHVAERLGVRHHPVEAVAAARDKRETRRRLEDAGVPQPEWQEVASVQEAVEAAGRLGGPVVVKPRTLAASRGVTRASTPAEVAAAAATALRLEAAAGCSGGGALVERFVPGPEVAVEGLVRDGTLEVVAVFDKPDPLEGPYFEETLLVAPSRLGAGRLRTVEAAVAGAVTALGLRDGPVHAEARAGDDVAVLEVAPRSIGGLCSGALRFEDGVSLEELILGDALGVPRGPARLAPGATGVMMLPITDRGVLGAVHGVDEARTVPGVDDVVVSIPPGGEVVPLPEGDRYLGFVFARGATPALVEETLRIAYARLRIEVVAAV